MNITPSVLETKMNNCYDSFLDAVKTYKFSGCWLLRWKPAVKMEVVEEFQRFD